MADQWYYEANGQQTGPVDLAELQRLAAAGQLQPTDLVWKAGMHQWAPAGGTRGLFPGERGLLDLPISTAPEPAPPAAVPEAVPAAETSPRPRQGPRPVAVRTHKSAPPPTGMSPGAKVAIWTGIGVSVLVVVVIAIVIIVSARSEQGDPAIVNGRGSYVVKFVQNGRDSRAVRFTTGRQVWITLTSDRNTAIQLSVFDPQGRPVALNPPPIGGNVNVSFWPSRTGLYRIEVANFGPGGNRSVVRCN
jgi:hypothetical protein